MYIYLRCIKYVLLLRFAISGTKRFDSEKAGDREVQRTMLELLNQLDGFQPNDDIKVEKLIHFHFSFFSVGKKKKHEVGVGFSKLKSGSFLV